MSALYIALPVSLLLVVAAVIAFIWSVRSGQLDDLETPAVRLLLDDEGARGESEKRQSAANRRVEKDGLPDDK